jgi:hypothetical protein
MRYRLTFAAGLALGYVLGARAGREHYEKLRKSAQDFLQNPAVRNTAESAAQQGRQLAGRAYHSVSDRFGEHMPESVTGRMRAMRVRADGRTGRPVSDDWGTSDT